MQDFIIIMFILLVYDIVGSIMFIIMKKYLTKDVEKINNECGKSLNPSEIAKAILEENSITDIEIIYAKDSSYVPKTKTIYIQNEILNGTNILNCIAAVHECGHAIQHKNHKILFRIIAVFSIINKTVTISSFLLLLFLIPHILSMQNIIILLLISAALHMVNGILLLFLEKDASAKGLKEVKEICLFTEEECEIIEKVLGKAFYTYIYNVLHWLMKIVTFAILLGVL